MTPPILTEPQHYHRVANLTVDPYGRWRASCTCRAVFDSRSQGSALRALRSHVSTGERRFRQLRNTLRAAAGSSVSMVEEGLC